MQDSLLCSLMMSYNQEKDFLLTFISVCSLGPRTHAHNECQMKWEELSQIAETTGDEISDSEDVKKTVPNAKVVLKGKEASFSDPRRVPWNMKEPACIKIPPTLAVHNTFIERE